MTEREIDNLIYGERVELDWTDTSGKPIKVQGLYGGRYKDESEKVVVTLTSTDPNIHGIEVITNASNLRLVEHPKLEGEYYIQADDSLSFANSSEPYVPCTVTYSQIEEPSDESEDDIEYDRMTLYEMRDNIMDNFNFDKVKRTMDALDWKWYKGGELENMEVPTISEIRTQARKILDELINRFGTDHQIYGTGTGGFEGSIYANEETGNPCLTLQFVVSEWYETPDESEEYKESYLKRMDDGGPVLPI